MNNMKPIGFCLFVCFCGLNISTRVRFLIYFDSYLCKHNWHQGLEIKKKSRNTEHFFNEVLYLSFLSQQVIWPTLIIYPNRFSHCCSTPLLNKYMNYWAKLQTDRKWMLFRHTKTQNLVLSVRILGGRGGVVVDGFPCVETNRIGNYFVSLHKTGDEPAGLGAERMGEMGLKPTGRS